MFVREIESFIWKLKRSGLLFFNIDEYEIYPMEMSNE